MEARLKQIEQAPKRTRRATMKDQARGGDFDDLSKIKADLNKAEADKGKSKGAKPQGRHSMFVKHDLAG